MKKAMMIAATLFTLQAAMPVLAAEEIPYMGPETVRDITPEEALNDPSIIRINTAGSHVDACIETFHIAIASLH